MFWLPCHMWCGFGVHTLLLCGWVVERWSLWPYLFLWCCTVGGWVGGWVEAHVCATHISVHCKWIFACHVQPSIIILLPLSRFSQRRRRRRWWRRSRCRRLNKTICFIDNFRIIHAQTASKAFPAYKRPSLATPSTTCHMNPHTYSHVHTHQPLPPSV